jgi:hypothetical protein
MTKADDDKWWRCPKCTAPAGEHGKGDCAQKSPGMCSGLICECATEDMKGHGTPKNPCTNATCFHCGWWGQIPEPRVLQALRKFDPSKLKGWAKQAFEAGWKPPKGWIP